MSAVIMVVGTALFLAVPEWLMGLFASDPATIEAGATALRIISAGFIVSAVSVTSSGALEGLGMGTPSLIISLFRYTAGHPPRGLYPQPLLRRLRRVERLLDRGGRRRRRLGGRLPPLRDGKGAVKQQAPFGMESKGALCMRSLAPL